MNKLTAWNPGSDDPEAPLRNTIDWWGLWVRRKGLIFFGVVACVALGAVYYFQATPIYESVAEVYIVERTPPTVPVEGIDGGSRYGRPEKHGSPHELIVASPLIVGQAVDDDGLMQRPSFAPLGYTTAELVDEWLTEKQLSAFAIDGNSNVLELSFRCPDPEDSAAVLRSIIRSYERFLGDTHQSVSLETAELIRKAKDDLMHQLNEKEAEYSRFRQEAPLIWKDGEGKNFHVERQAQIEQARAGMLLRRSELHARAHALESGLKRGDKQESLLLLISQMAEKPLNELNKGLESPLHNNLLKLLVLDKQLRSTYGPSHPQVLAVAKQVEMATEYIKQVEAKASLGREASDDPAKFVASYLQSLQDELASVEEQLKQLDTLFQQEQENAKQLAAWLVRDTAHRNDLERTQQLFEATVKRLEEINIVKDYGTYNVKVISRPELGEKVAPAPLIVFGLAGLFGVAGGIGLAYVVDLADRNFRSPQDISRQLQLPLVGHVPAFTPRQLTAQAGSKVAAAVATFHQPKSPLAEAYRTVRTSLYFSTRGRRMQVIQVTSPMPGDGKSTLAANLAVTIADTGKQVLLIDADFRRPTVHKLFGVAAKVGLADVIAGVAEPQDAVQLCEIDNLSLIGCGPLPSNPSELLTSPRFEDLLAVLREKFDFVIIDTPPLLAVSDPCAVAPRVDGVLLALRLDRNARPQAMRAAELLADVEADVIGVVVNALKEKQSGYSGDYHGYRAEYESYFKADASVVAVPQSKQLQPPVA